MQDWVLIISLNAQNPIVSNAKTSHRVALSVGGSWIGVVLRTFFVDFLLQKAPKPIDITVQC
jgi:hypothetical protein